jgi:hypothetical protein
MDEQEDGSKIVRIAGEVTESQEDGQTVYTYDEVLFTLEAGRTETVADIEEDLFDWWDYGSQPEEPLPTLEERVAAIEDYIIGGGEI